MMLFFFFQAEDGIRDLTVTGVQTCALPILTELGENRVQEALPKPDDPVGRRAGWHLIGHLQRNKAKLVPGRFALVQSVDSLALAEELERRAAALGVAQRVLLQVNVAGEAQKSGCAPDEAPALARAVARLPRLGLEGLMTLAPLTDDVDVQRRSFGGLRRLRDALQEDGLWLPTLSMGIDRKSTRLNSSHSQISYAVFCLKKKKKKQPEVDAR